MEKLHERMRELIPELKQPLVPRMQMYELFTPQLHHYLRVLNKSFNIASLELDGQGTCMCEMNRTSNFGDKMWGCINFNLTTGQPATEKDAEKLLELIS